MYLHILVTLVILLIYILLLYSISNLLHEIKIKNRHNHTKIQIVKELSP